MKKVFILSLISLLLVGCSQPNTQAVEEPLPVENAEETTEVTEMTDSAPLSDQEKNIIPPEAQTVKVTFTQEALDQIDQDLDDPGSRNKVLKIKPAID